MIRRLLFFAFILLAPHVQGEEVILLPVFIHTAGAFGSEFTTDLTLFNASDNTLVVRGLRWLCSFQCPGPHDRVILDPRISATNFYLDGNPGLLLHVSDPAALRAHLRVKDLTRQRFSAGTEIRVVREAEFRSDTLYLLGITVPPRFRHTLRIYGLEPTAALVRFVTADNAVLAQEIVSLSPPTSESQPAFAQVVAFPASATPFRVEVTSQTSTRLWAFISTTNNETQEITTINPQ